MPRTWKSLFVVPFLLVFLAPYAFGQTTNLDVIPTSWNPPVSASQTDISVFITGDSLNAPWTVVSNALWLTVSAPSGSGNGTVTAYVTTSTDTLSRQGVITITGTGTTPLTRTVTVNQAAAPQQTFLSVSQTNYNFGATLNRDTIQVTIAGTNPSMAWTATSGAAWLTLSPTGGNGSGQFVATAATNGGSPRSTSIIVHGANTIPTSDTIAITQDGQITSLAIAPTSWAPNDSAHSTTVTMTIAGGNPTAAWTATTFAPSWLTVSPTSGTGSRSLTATVNSNFTTINSRSSYFVVYGTGTTPSTDTFFVTQAGRPPVTNLSVNPNTWTTLATADQHTFTVNVTGDLPGSHWVANSDQAWLTPSPNNGNGTATFIASVTANPNNTNRTATITITGTNTIPSAVTVAVTQIGQGINSYLTVTPTTWNAPSTATTDTINVGITGPNPNAAWSISSDAVWLTAAPVSGNGTTNILASVTANPDTVTRTGTLTVTGTATQPLTQTFVVTQAARALVTNMSISPTTWNPPRTASVDTVDVTIAGDVPTAHWTAAVGTGGWLTVSSGSHNGSNRFIVSASNNGAGGSRSGTVIVTGTGTTPIRDTLFVTQSGTNTTTLSASPLTWNPTYSATETPISIFVGGSNPFANWTISSSAIWLSAAPANGAGNATTTASVTANPDTSARTATLTITGTGTTPTSVTVTVTQAGRPPESNLAISPTTWNPTAIAGQMNFNVSITGDITNNAWVVSSDSPWLTVAPLNGNGSTTITGTVTANPGSTYRTGNLTLTGVGTTPTSVVVQVTQAGTGPVTQLTVAPLAWTPSYIATGTAVAITISGSNPNASWSTSSNAAWLTASPTSGSGTTTINANVTANPDTSARNATLTITGTGTTPVTRVLTVTQDGRPPMTTMAVNQTNWNSPQPASHDTVLVTISGDAPTSHWAAYSPATWISESPNNGNGSGTFLINTLADAGGTRNSYVVVTGSGTVPTTDTIYVTQIGTNTTIMSVSPTTWNPTGTAGSTPISITMSGANPNAAWAVSGSAAWITPIPPNGTGSSIFTANILANPDTLPRSTNIIVTGTGTLPLTDTIHVTQAGRAVLTNIAINPTSWSPGANATQTSFAVDVSGDHTGSHWVVTSNQAWLTITAPNNGNGSGSFIANVTTNQSATYRAATLTLVGTGTTPDTTLISVIQLGTAPTTQLNVSPSSADAPNTAGSTSVNISIVGANPNAAWSTSSNAGWLTASPSSGNGGQSINANYSANPDTGTRIGTLTITGTGTTPLTRTFVVTQVGRPPVSTLSVSLSNIVMPQTGQTDSVLVTIGGDILTASWHVTSSAAWLTANPNTVIGSASFGATATANVGFNTRSGYLVVTGTNTNPTTDTVFVTQGGLNTTTMTLSPTSLSPTSAAGQTAYTITMSGANPNSAWAVTSGAAWLTSSRANGTGTATPNAIYTANADTLSRSSYLVITGTGTVPTTDTLFVTQGGRPVATTLAVNPTVWNPTSAAGQTSFAITLTGDHTSAPWTVQSNAAWLTPAPTGGSGNGSFIASVTANSDTTYRTGVLSIHANTATPDTIRITVVQGGTNPVTQLNVAPMSVNAPYTAGQNSITITISGFNPNANTSVTSNATWLTANPASGSGTRSFNGVYTANPDTSVRSASLTITGAGTTPLTRTVLFTQAGRPPQTNMALSARTLTHPSAGQTDSVLVSISGDNPTATWHAISSNTTWLTVNPSTRNGSGSFAATSAFNFSVNPRSAYIVVTGTGTTPVTDTVFVTQVGRNTTTLTVAPLTINAAYSAGQTPVTITIAGANPTAAWTAVSGATWLTLTGGSGNGSGSFTANYAANPDTLPRSTTAIVVGTGTTPTSDTVHVTQAGRPVVTNLSVVPSSWNPTASASQTSLLVTLSGDHPNSAWTVSSTAAWLTALPTGGTGSGSFIATVSANPDTAYRAAVLYVRGNGTTPDTFSIPVTQAGQSPTTLLVVSPSSYNYVYGGGGTNVAITMTGFNPNAAWTVNSTAGWLTPSMTNGTGTTTIVATATANPDTSIRSATLTITGTGTTPTTRTVSITQDARPPLTNMSISHTFWDAVANGGTDTIRVLINGDNLTAHWTVTSNAVWLTSAPSSGNGTASFIMTAGFNANTTSRSGLIIVHGTGTTPTADTVSVTQAGRSVTNMAISPTTMTVPHTASTDTFALTITGGNPGAAWTTSTNSSWFIVTPAAGNSSGSVVAHVAANPDTAARSARFVVTGNGTTPTSDTVLITQNGRPPVTNLAASPTTWNPTASAGSTSIAVNITGDNPTAHWTVASNQTWCTIAPNNGNGTGNFLATVIANPDTGYRSATLTITGTGTTPLTTTVLVTQAGTGPATTMSVTPTTWTPAGTAGSTNLSVTIAGGNPNAAWSVSSNAAWLTALPISGNGTTTVAANVTANPDTTSRSGTLTFTGTGTQPTTRTVVVTQSGRALVTQLTLSTHSWSASEAAVHDTVLVTITGDNPTAHWTAASTTPAWLSVAPNTGNGTGAFVATTTANFAQTSRTGLIVLTGTGTTPTRDTVVVTQAGRAPTSMAVSPVTWNSLASTAGTDTIRVTIAGGNPSADWTVSSSATWLSFAPGNGIGTGYFIASITSNPDTLIRSAYLIVAGNGTTPINDTVQVSQAGRAPLTNLAVAPLTWNAASGAVNTQIAITISGDHLTAPWTAVSNQTWLNVAPGSGNGSGTITATTIANPDTTPRTATITITGNSTTPGTRVVNVTQAGRGLVTNLTVSPLTWTPPSTATATNITVTIAGDLPNSAWSLVSSAVWLSVAPTSGNGTGNFTATVTANPDTAVRTATITVNGNSTTPASRTVTVTQTGRAPITNLSATPTSWIAPNTAGQNSVTVTISGDNPTAHWVASTPASWVNLTPNNGNGSGSFNAAITANPDTLARIAVVTITGTGTTPASVTYTITQTGRTPVTTLSVSPVVWNPGGNADSINVTVTVAGDNPNLQWTVSWDQTWVSASPTSGSGNGQFRIRVPVNNTGFGLSSHVIVSAPGATPSADTITVNQISVGVRWEYTSNLPQEYSVARIYPNPFNPSTTIEVGLPQAATLIVTVYNIQGRQVAELFHGNANAGYHAIRFDARNLPSGTYFIRAMVAGKMNQMKRIELIK